MDVKTLCLGVLTMGEASGYEIKKVFEDSFSHFYVAGFGSIYPALAELTRQGHVISSSIEQEKRPAKKVYRITGEGREAFTRALEATYPSHRVRSDFMVLTAFAHLQTSQRLDEVLSARVEDIEEQLAHIDRCIAEKGETYPGAAFTAGYARTVLLAGKDYILQHRDELLQAIKRQGE